MTRLRFGILGPGAVATKAVGPALASSSHAELTVVGSRAPERAARYAERFGARPVTGYAAVIDDPRVDAVYIALPNALHAEWILRAVDAGKHVLCEKPAVLTLAEAEAVVEAAARARVRVMEGYMFRFHPQHALSRRLINDGTLGSVRHLSAAFGFPPLGPENFRYQRVMGGGALYDAGGYPLAAARWLFGEEPCRLSAVLEQGGQSEVDERGAIQLEFPSGRTAHAVFGFDYSYWNSYMVWGSTGRLVAERAFSVPRDVAPSMRLISAEGTRDLPTQAEDQFRAMIDAFCAAVQSGDSTGAFERELLAHAAVVDAAVRSARTHESVELSQADAAGARGRTEPAP